MTQILSSTFYCFSDIYHTMQPIYQSFNMISLAATKNNNLHMTEYPCTFQANNTCKISYPYFYLYQSGCYRAHFVLFSSSYLHLQQPTAPQTFHFLDQSKKMRVLYYSDIATWLNATLTPIIVQLSFSDKKEARLQKTLITFVKSIWIEATT